MKITYYGHACFLIETDKHKLLFDPFISFNELAKSVKLDEIECDYMLISHGHEDHVADAEQIAKRTGAKLVSNFEIVSWFEAKGIENNQGELVFSREMSSTVQDMKGNILLCDDLSDTGVTLNKSMEI